MVSYNDCLALLLDLKTKGINTNEQIKDLVTKGSVTLEALKFINDNRELDLSKFYEKLRKSYNNKKSNLYINIMKTLDEPTQVITTLNSYALQVTLFSKQLEDKDIFFKCARLEDVYRCLLNYTRSYDLIPCIKILNLIKTDIKTLESIYR